MFNSLRFLVHIYLVSPKARTKSLLKIFLKIAFLDFGALYPRITEHRTRTTEIVTIVLN